MTRVELKYCRHRERLYPNSQTGELNGMTPTFARTRLASMVTRLALNALPHRVLRSIAMPSDDAASRTVVTKLWLPCSEANGDEWCSAVPPPWIDRRRRDVCPLIRLRLGTSETPSRPVPVVDRVMDLVRIFDRSPKVGAPPRKPNDWTPPAATDRTIARLMIMAVAVGALA